MRIREMYTKSIHEAGITENKQTEEDQPVWNLNSEEQIFRAVEAKMAQHRSRMIETSGNTNKINIIQSILEEAIGCHIDASKRDVELNTTIERAESLARPPGFYWVNVCGIIFSKKTMEHVVMQIVDDWREEYLEALKEGSGRLRLFCINMRKNTSLFIALIWLPLSKVLAGLAGLAGLLSLK